MMGGRRSTRSHIVLELLEVADSIFLHFSMKLLKKKLKNKHLIQLGIKLKYKLLKI